MSATGSDALGAQALVGGKGETCDASMGVGGARGDGAAPAGRDGGVCGRGLGAGGDVAPKHTPESWEVPEGGLYPIVCTRDGKHIATLADTGDEMEARARLIAAAPDLLAALRELAAVFAEDGPAYEALLEAEYEDAANSERHPSFKHVRDTVLAKARAAIAKAEARS